MIAKVVWKVGVPAQFFHIMIPAQKSLNFGTSAIFPYYDTSAIFWKIYMVQILGNYMLENFIENYMLGNFWKLYAGNFLELYAGKFFGRHMLENAMVSYYGLRQWYQELS